MRGEKVLARGTKRGGGVTRGIADSVVHEEELTLWRMKRNRPGGAGSMRTEMEVKERKVASVAEETQARRK
jgi:hypothetical protein